LRLTVFDNEMMMMMMMMISDANARTFDLPLWFPTPWSQLGVTGVLDGSANPAPQRNWKRIFLTVVKVF